MALKTIFRAMFSIARATYKRVVRIQDTRIAVRPPTVGEALTVLDAAQQQDLGLLWEVLDAWLPVDAAGALRRVPEHGRQRIVEALITQGCNLEAVVSMEVDGAAVGATWRAALSMVAATYRVSPWDIMGWPFPFFLEMAVEARAERAREQIRLGEAASLPHLGQEAEVVLQRWQRQAWGETPGDLMRDDLVRTMTPDEVTRNQQDLLRPYGG
jgi:hypothetical protein